ncbi:MAG: TonB-dependent receptor [Bacteroidota bacterium]|nr:TonB-dependent receptor [Bacteroidota bacterium]
MNKRLLILSVIVFLTGQLFAQTVVKGVVKSESGESIPGVTVMVKGSKNGTVSDVNGKYSITASDKDILVITAVGMKKQEITVGAKSQIDINMEEDAHTLDEAVVVGYGTVKKAHLTGAVSSVSAKEIEDIPAGNLAAAIANKMSGVNVSGGIARPGIAATITIRNPVSWAKDPSQGTDPLYVIDDIISSAGAFNSLDPTQIESISALKDASASIYGARASNGVILVTTKRGKSGKPRITYSGSYGLETAELPKMMNAYEYATYMNDYNYLGNVDKSNSAIYSNDELDYFKTHSWNWLDQAWKNSAVQRHAVNVSGGSDNATYFVGATYFTQDGNFKGINYDRWSLRASADINLAAGFKIGLTVSGNFNKNHKFYAKLGGSSDERDYQMLLDTPPDTPPYVDGWPVANNTSSASSYENFHFFEVLNSGSYSESKGTGLQFNFNASYEVPFIKGLKFNGQYSQSRSNGWNEQYGNSFTLWKFNMLGNHGHIFGTPSAPMTIVNGDNLTYSPSFSTSYQLNGGLSYGRKIGLHEFSIMSTIEQSESSSKGLSAAKNNILPGASAEYGFYAASGALESSTSFSESGSLSVAGRANYNYAGKYLAEFDYRFDSSTKFASSKRWAFFPSISAGWVISEEDFLKDSRAINYLKIRGSVGLLGNDNAKPWLYQQRYSISTSGSSFGTNNETRNVGLNMAAQPNPDVTWDNSDKFNIGFDTRFLDSRLSSTIEGFFNHGYDILTSRTSSTSLTVGGTMPDENYGVRNDWGMEFQVGWEDKIGNVNYNISTNFGWSNDIVIVKDQALAVVGTWKDLRGRPSDYGVSGYYCTGMLRTQADVDKLLAQNPNYTIFGAVPAPGMLNYRDIRGPVDVDGKYTGPDGKIDGNDEDYIAKTPRGIQGCNFNLGASWKGLRFSASINCAWGGMTQLESQAYKTAATTTFNLPQIWADHWTPTNTNAKYPAPYYNSSYKVASDFWTVKSFSLNVRSFDISYTIPKTITNRLKMDNFRIYLSALNPFALYNPYSFRSAISGNFHNYPNLSTYTLGVNISM